KLLWVWFFHALAHGTYHARIVYPKYFNHRIALAKLFYAIRDGETPGFLVPGHPQGGIAIPIVGNVDFSAHAGNGLDQFCDALDAGVPLAVRFLGVRFQPGCNGGKRSEEHTSELQSPCKPVCPLPPVKKSPTSAAALPPRAPNSSSVH